MATRTQSRTAKGSSTSRKTGERSSAANNTRKTATSSTKAAGNGAGTASNQTRAQSRTNENRSAFSWGDNNTGAMVGAALVGATIGFAANYGRKLLMQGMEASLGDWDQILSAEHDAALAIFDKMLATDESQSFKRKMLLMQLTHALDKHAHQEEMVVYPALREANIEVEADELEQEHGQVKTYLYELSQMKADAPNWLEKVREFRMLISRHAHMEEEQVFPSFKQDLTEEQNHRITKLVNRDGFWMA